MVMPRSQSHPRGPSTGQKPLARPAPPRRHRLATRTLALLLTGALAGCAPFGTGSRPAEPPPRGAVAQTPAGAQCLRELSATGADFTPLPDRSFEQGCSLLNTVRIASVSSDEASLMVTNLGPATCEVSRAFAAWARFGADRAAQQLLGSPLRSIETFGSYSCRNVAGSGRRSAHCTGAAIDVSAFVLEDGRRITVRQGWNGGSAQEREFLRVVQNSACRRFATVLGPEYNAAHHDHFHFEGVARGRSYCR